ASPSWRRWLVRAGRPPGLRLGGPPGARPARLGPLGGRRAGDRRVLLPEQTVHLGRSRGGVAAPGAPQPMRIPAGWLVSPQGVPLGLTQAHQQSQGERQEAPPGIVRGATAGGSRWPHGAGVAGERWAWGTRGTRAGMRFFP
uniref:Uncharacterized protein n=1 Tax=Jaculus jaculus TaxID=51337 RepID=A0A8C5KC61_JACJA